MLNFLLLLDLQERRNIVYYVLLYLKKIRFDYSIPNQIVCFRYSMYYVIHILFETPKEVLLSTLFLEKNISLKYTFTTNRYVSYHFKQIFFLHIQNLTSMHVLKGQRLYFSTQHRRIAFGSLL